MFEDARQVGNVIVLPSAHAEVRAGLAELRNSAGVSRWRALQTMVDTALKTCAMPTIAQVCADPALLDVHNALHYSTADLRQKGLGDYVRHIGVLSALFAKLTDEQVHGNGRWSFVDDSKLNRTYVMPAEVSGFKGMKIIQSHPGNLLQGLPRSNASILLFDVGTGLLAAVMAASSLTPIKTAAQSAVVLQLWHEHNGKLPVDLGILGGGPVSREHFSAFKQILGATLRATQFYSPRESARTLVAAISAQDSNRGVSLCASAGALQSSSNVIVAATTASGPVLNDPHIASVDIPRLIFALGPNDISADALRAADLVVVDDPIGANQLQNSLGDFLRSTPDNVRSLTEVVRSPELLRRSGSVVFAPMGIGLSDVAVCVDLLRT